MSFRRHDLRHTSASHPVVIWWMRFSVSTRQTRELAPADAVRARGQERPEIVEAANGFEPLNGGFADLSLSHLGTPPSMENWANGLSIMSLNPEQFEDKRPPLD
jgi:hypothetical protein